MAKITANNIQTGAITSDKLDSSVASNLAAADNANTIATIATAVAAAAFATANTNAAILANSAPPLITTITIADSSYNALDDTAANTTGGFCIITGSGFVSTPTVVFGTTSAPAVSFISSTTLRVQIPALTAASYPVYVVNSNGGTGIRIDGLTTSSFPAWSTGATLSNQSANTSFSVNLSANSDSSITYANTTALPAGTTLAANGLFSGTVSIGAETTYTFDVKATDVENQDASRTFSLTVRLGATPGLYSFGVASYGVNGQNEEIAKSSPVQVGTQSTWNKFSAGYNTALVTKTDGTLWGWGQNNVGQLGLGNTVARSSPVQIGTDTTWNLITSHAYHSLATKTDGTLWAWGSNGSGVQGRSNTVQASSPTQVGASTNWNGQIIAVNINSAAIKTDGTLWTWGRGQNGALGIGVVTARSSPTQVGALTNWSQIAADGTAPHMLARRTDGTLWAWGAPTYGQLGSNTPSPHRSSPVQIGTDTTWNLIHCGSNSCFAIKTDGTLWAWGYNSGGELGHNDRVNKSSPTQVGSATNWSLIKSESSSTLAIKTDGTLWYWGSGASGSPNPLNDTVYRSSPVQVGTLSNWADLDVGPQSRLIRAS